MSSLPGIQALGNGRYRIDGPMSVETVPVLWPELEKIVRQRGEAEVSLAGVNGADSAAVACLVAGLREARRAGCVLRYHDLPESMHVIIDVSELDPLFAVDDGIMTAT